MNKHDEKSFRTNLNRRNFLKSTGAAVIAGALPYSVGFAQQPSALSSNTLKVGLIGCGGRGAGAASQAIQADPNVVLTAMGDVFSDRLDESYNELVEMHPDKVKVDKAHRFIGFDAYKKVIASDVDVVLLTTPPAFRPDHMMAAVEAGKHTFCENPLPLMRPVCVKYWLLQKKQKRKNFPLCQDFASAMIFQREHCSSVC